MLNCTQSLESIRRLFLVFLAFLVSVVLLGAGLYVRLKIAETPVFRQIQGQQQLARRTPLREALTQAPRQILLLAGTLTTMFALFYIGTTYLTSYGTSPKGAGLSRTLVLSIGIGEGIAMAAGVIASAIAADRFGRRAVVVFRFSNGPIAIRAYAIDLRAIAREPRHCARNYTSCRQHGRGRSGRYRW